MATWLLLRDERRDCGLALALEEIEAIAGLPESDPDRLVVVQARFNNSTTGAAASSIQRGGRVALRLLAQQFRDAWAAAPLRRLSVRTSGIGEGAYEGESGDLLFALATFIELAGRNGLIELPRRPFAATGTLDANGHIGPVDGLRSKIEAALEPLPQGLPPGSIVFYPTTVSNGDAPLLDAALLDRARKRGVELLPVEAVEEALQALGVAVLWWHRDQPPFRALGVYQVEHRPIFFGRDDQVSSFVERLQHVADSGTPGGLVEASSGAGKSSFVQAGLLARLRLQFRPGSLPVEYAVWQPRQAGAVEGADIEEASAARSVLSNWKAKAGVNSIGFNGLDDVVDAASFEALAATLNHTGLDGRRLVWVVDQFEEIFTLRFSESTRRAFARFLLTLQRLGVWVVAALRTEFKSRFMALADEQGRPLLVQVFERLMFPLARMPMEALGHIITEPAKVAGLAFEIGRDGIRLDAVLRDDALGADSMPLVGYALNELWLRRESPVTPGVPGAQAILTFNAYRDICGGQARGGIKRVLGIEAERAFGSLPPRARDELPALLDTLAVPVNGETREAARPAELSQWPEGSPGWQLIEALREARLLVIEAPTATASARVRVVHEALFDGWDLAREHLEQSRDRRALVRRLESYREHWATTASAADALLSSAADLELARALRPTLRGQGSRELAAYIDASLAAALQRDAEKARRDLAAQRRRHQIIAALASGVVALGGALIYARQQTDAAVRSQFLLLTQEAERSLERGDAASGLLIALAARDLVNDGDLRSHTDPVLRKGLAETRELAVYPGISGRDVWVAFSPSGERLAVPKGNSIDVRDPGHDSPPVLLSTTAPPVKVVFGAEARLLAAILSNGDVKAWVDTGSAGWKPYGVPNAVEKAVDVAVDAASNRITALVAGNTLLTWPAGRNDQLRRVAVPADWSARRVTLSPDGHLLASLDGRGILEIWEVRDSSLALVHREPDVGAHAGAAFGSGSRQVAWTRADGAVQVWNGLAHSKPQLLRGPASPSAVMAFDASGSRLAASASDGSIALWELSGGDGSARWLRGHDGAITALSFIGDGSVLTSASIDGSARIWPLATGTGYSTLLRGHSGAIAALAGDPRGRFIATAGVDGTARLWSARSGPLLHRLEGPATRLHHASFSAAGDEVITGGTGGAWIWRREAAGWQVAAMPMERPAPIWRTFASGQPGIAGAATLDGEVRFWEMRRDSPPVGHSTHQAGSITSLAHSRRFTHAVSASDDGTVSVWDLKHPERPEQTLRHGTRVGSIAIDDSAREVLSIQDSGVVLHWERDTTGVFAQRKVHTFSATGVHPESMVSMADDGRVAAASFDRSIAVWRKGLHNPATELPSAASALWHLALSPDSTQIAAASLGGELYVWNLSTPSRPPMRLNGHRSTSTMVSFSPDGTRLASAGFDGRVGLWDLRMLEPRPTLFDGHHGRVMSVEFAPDGNTILSAGEDGVAIIWPAVAGAQLEALAARSVPRCLSPSQLARVGLSNNAEILRCNGSDAVVDSRTAGYLR